MMKHVCTHAHARQNREVQREREREREKADAERILQRSNSWSVKRMFQNISQTAVFYLTRRYGGTGFGQANAHTDAPQIFIQSLNARKDVYAHTHREMRALDKYYLNVFNVLRFGNCRQHLSSSGNWSLRSYQSSNK